MERQRGDITAVAKITKYSYDMAKAVAYGTRKNIVISQAFEQLQRDRERMVASVPARKNKKTKTAQ